MDKLYKIGEFSKLSGLSMQTLRLYDKKGILKAKYIDNENSYRYYDFMQLMTVNFIQGLKFSGMSLSDIKKVVNGKNLKEKFPYFVNKKDDIKKEIEILKNRLKLIEDLVYGIESFENYQDGEIKRKFIGDRKVIFIKEFFRANSENISREVRRLIEKANSLNVQLISNNRVIFHNEYKDSGEELIEIYFEISGDAESDNIKSLEKGEYLTIQHRGDYISKGNKYVILKEYAKNNNIEIEKEINEISLIGPESTDNEEEYMVEIQARIKNK